MRERAGDHPRRRRGRGQRARGRDAGRRRQGRRRRDPGLLLRAEARRAGRRLPDVPGRDRGDPEAADRLLDPGPRRDGRLHAHRPGDRGPERGRRVPARQPPARLPGLRQGRRVPAAGHRDGLGARAAAASPTRSATSASRSRSRRWCGSTASAASSATAASASARRSPRTSSCSCSSAASNSYVGTFDDRPYIAPFHGNIIELCPVGALTSEAYRFRARPVGHRGRGLDLHALPEPVQRQVHGPRRARPAGARPRQPRGRRRLALRQGPLRLPDDLLGGADHRAAARAATAAGWERGARGRGGASSARARPDRRDRRRRGLQRGGLPGAADRPRRARLAARDRARRAARRRRWRRSRPPELGAPIAAIDDAESILVIGADPLHAMPILDLRLRKAVRHNELRLVIASERPTALDGGAEETARYAPGDAAAFLAALAAELGPDPAARTGRAPRQRRRRAPRRRAAPGQDAGRSGASGSAAAPTATAALDALRNCAAELEVRRGGRRRLLESPTAPTPAASARSAACPAPARASRRPTRAATSTRSRQGLASGELDGVILLHADPVRDLPDGPGWAKALNQARTVVAISSFEDASTKAADIVFPAEAYAEKEGTVTHPDGRLQRLRPAVPRPGQVRPIWQVLAELSAALGDETGIDSAPEALAAIAAEVPFYAGLTPEEIGGTGIRWQEREARRAPGSRGMAVAAADGRHSAAATPDPPRPRRPALGHLPRPLGGRGHRAQRRAAVPGARAAGRDRARRTPRSSGSTDGDEVHVRSNGTSRARPGRAPRADPARRRVPDRGHGAEQRQRAQRRATVESTKSPTPAPPERSGGGGRAVIPRSPTPASPRRPGSWS